MRPIKFRAWDKKTKEMFHPGHLSENSQKEHTMGFNGWPLMQFTGILDKNGKEIYIGDIVKFNYSPLNSDHIGYIIEDLYFNTAIQDIKDQNHYYHIQYSKIGDIIGNIYENHEILTK